jgi:oxygen-independent coproporphyrinogen III oxidase
MISHELNPHSGFRIPRCRVPGLYIHVPFCKTKCGYCDFYSVTGLPQIPVYLDHLLQEMKLYRDRFPFFDTLYIGGGTPSLLSAAQLEAILEGVRKCFTLLPETEITLEVNPGDVDSALLRDLRRIGINRLNIGIQSFDGGLLGFLGRRHSEKEAVSAIHSAREAGFDNVGLDLIYAVPGQEISSWMETLDQALAFRPEHLSCYQLTLEPGTPLGRRHEEGEWILAGEQLQFDFFMKTAERLEQGSYLQYEVSNFARGSAYLSRHNQKYWDHTPYLGFGPAAHSFSDRERWWNHRSVEQYVTDLQAGKRPVAGRESLSLEQLRLEALFLGLRTKKGIDLQDFYSLYQSDLAADKKETLPRLQEEGLLSIENGSVVPTRAGLAVADRLALM